METTFSIPAYDFGEEGAQTLIATITVLAMKVAQSEKDAKRQKRMFAVIDKKFELLEHMSIKIPDRAAFNSFLSQRVESWEEHKRNLLLVEAAFADPFAPYQIKVPDKSLLSGLKEIAYLIHLRESRVDEINETIKSARKAHKHIRWGQVAVGTILGIAILGTGGYLLAPTIAAAIGASAGLSGAAAVSYGLALLGGGSLAAGGFGMVGGTIAVTGAGAIAGGLGLGGIALWNAGYIVAVGELVKLQTSYQQVLMQSKAFGSDAAKLIDQMVSIIEQFKAEYKNEQNYNDPRTDRLKEFDKVIGAYEDALKWMKAIKSNNK